jgi:hypothetical protein
MTLPGTYTREIVSTPLNVSFACSQIRSRWVPPSRRHSEGRRTCRRDRAVIGLRNRFCTRTGPTVGSGDFADGHHANRISRNPADNRFMFGHEPKVPLEWTEFDENDAPVALTGISEVCGPWLETGVSAAKQGSALTKIEPMWQVPGSGRARKQFQGPPHERP